MSFSCEVRRFYLKKQYGVNKNLKETENLSVAIFIDKLMTMKGITLHPL